LSDGPILTVGTPTDKYMLSAGGGLLLWIDGPAYNRDIFACDLLSGETAPVNPAPGHQVWPDASSEYIVWEDRSAGSRIYAYNRQTRAEFHLSNWVTEQTQPAIDGRYVVWQDSRDKYAFFSTDICGYDLQAGQEIEVCSQPGKQLMPDISGNVAVWVDTRNGGRFDIYGKDLCTGQEFPICTALGEQNEPAIDGNFVVWLDSRPGAPGIYGYDLSTGQEFPISVSSTYRYRNFPQVSGNLVVWEEETTPGDVDIYGAYVPEPAGMTWLLLMAGALLRRPRRRAANS